MSTDLSRTIRILLKTGAEVLFVNAGFNEKQANTLTIFDAYSHAVLAEYSLHDVESWGFVER